jgi:murein DD-endopeptidase MepM/ murein hydrolase activator NlpD
MIMELAAIFGWDIDFALDIRRGDHFTVVYQEYYLEGKKVRDGDILAAEFTNQGKSYRAIRYVDADGNAGFYTPEGLSLRKAFLRTPVKFSRISSRFTLHRKHPILNRIRAHKGVDYAAPRGTPIRATGDGKVVFRGRKGGYGRTIVIQHGSKYSTLYGHMSRYNGKVKLGRRVRQGQVIGYVGSSGLATGPHLHYEFRIDGVHRNPLTVKLPVAEPIAKRYRDDFQKLATPLIAQLELLTRSLVARN